MAKADRPGIFEELKRRNVFRVAAAFLLVAWLLLQVVDVIAPILDLPGWFDRVVLVFLVIAFPVALLFAWAFELTPEGVKLEKNVDRGESITQQTGRKLDRVIIAVLALALIVSLTVNLRGDDEDAVHEPAPVAKSERDLSIAVLPFANRSANEADVFFVDGMHDDLLTQLAKLSALKVISRTSVLQYRNTEKSMRTIGEELGVSTLLEGGVQRAGDRIRINVQLIDAATDEHLWAETYNRELTTDNIFEIQEDIARRIADALHAALSPDEQRRIADRPTDNLKAYEAYLIGRQKLTSRVGPEVLESVQLFETAISEDSEFAEAYASLAEAYMVMNNMGDLSLDEMLARARPVVARAQSLNPDLGIVYNVMAGLAEYEGKLEQAEAYYLKAIELSPNYVTSYIWLGLFYENYLGRLEDAVRLYRRATELDPLMGLQSINIAFTLSALGRPDEAIEAVRAALRIAPLYGVNYAIAGILTSAQDGRLAEGMRWFQRAAQLDDRFLVDVAWGYWGLGDTLRARQWLQRSLEQFPDASSGLLLAAALHQAEREYREAGEIAERLAELSRDNIPVETALRILRDSYLEAGAADKVLSAYRAEYPELFAAEPEVHRSNVFAAVDLLLLLRLAGNDAGASALAARCLDVLHSTPTLAASGRGLKIVEVHALLDNRDDAINAMSEAVDSSFVSIHSQNVSRRNLASLSGDPEFQRMMTILEGRVAAERAKIDEMEAAGQLAAAPEQLREIQFDLTF